jgi:hypothetical protein
LRVRRAHRRPPARRRRRRERQGRRNPGRGHGRCDALVNNAAIDYSVSKAALNALTRILAAELWADGVLVNAVCPGWVATDIGGCGGRPLEDGAASVTWAVLLGDDEPMGGFFRDGRPVEW